MEDKKLINIIIYKYMLENTDKNHRATTSDLIKHLQNEWLLDYGNNSMIDLMYKMGVVDTRLVIEKRIDKRGKPIEFWIERGDDNGEIH